MGRFDGTAVPPVNELRPFGHGYMPPVPWPDPVVNAKDLSFHTSCMRDMAVRLSRTGDELRGGHALWRGQGWLAEPNRSTVGSWVEAIPLAFAVGYAYDGFDRFVGDLCQAHDDTATRFTRTADNYDATEQGLIDRLRDLGSPPAKITQGSDRGRVQPSMGEDWAASHPITADLPAQQADASRYTWEEIRWLLTATDPEAVGAVALAYRQLSSTLTGLTGKHAMHGAMVPGFWEGRNAVIAVGHIRSLHVTAAGLQAQAWAMHRAMDWYCGVLYAFGKDLPRPASLHPADVSAANWAAQQRMIALNQHIETARELMPPVICKNLPPPLGQAGRLSR